MLRRTEIGNCSISLVDAKNYMRYTGDSKDAEIQSALDTAIRRIEDVQNVSLRPMSVKLDISDPEDFNPLYLHPVSEIVSVKDSVSGADVDFSISWDNRKIKVAVKRDVTVEYTTAETPDIKDYKIAILSLTTLIFDGLTDDEAFRKVFNVYLTPKTL